MSEKLEEEVLCLAHTSIPCRERNNYTHTCGLEKNVYGPYKMTCEFKKVISVPSQKAEQHEEPIPEYGKEPKFSTDELPY